MSERKKIVVLTSRVPYPLEKGDKLRVYHQMKELAKNHDVYLLAISNQEVEQKSVAALEEFCKEVHIYRNKKTSILYNLITSWFAGLPFQVGYFFNSGAHYFINKLIDKIQPDHVFVQLVRMSEYVKHRKDLEKSLDYMDSFSMGMQRRKEKEKSLKKILFSWENQRLKRYEEKIFSEYEYHFIISEQDRETFEFDNAKKIHIVPNGLDKEFFKTSASVEKKYDLVFTGNMSYPPNVQAVEYIAKEILPVLWKSKPECNLLIAGANPASTVKALASEKITVTGWVDDIRDAYAEGRVFMAPLNIGTGLQNKLLEAMSMGLPSITSPLANNALNAKESTEILIANNPEEYATAALNLLQDEDLYQSIANNGRDYVHANFDWSGVVRDMEKIMFS